jgi:hypothetical protein
MKTIYHKPVTELLRDFVKESGIKKGETIQRKAIVDWFQKHYPKVKKLTVQAHITRFTTNAPSRVHYNPSAPADDVFYQDPNGQLRLYQQGVDPLPISELTGEQMGDERQDEGEEFAYEKDLRNYLSTNLERIEPGLELYEEEGITGLEYNAGGRFIDILALDKKGNFVVIELKVSKGYDRVVGQMLRYIGWVKENLADAGQDVRGVIVAREISSDLKIACSQVNHIDMYEYAMSVSVKKIS